MVNMITLQWGKTDNAHQFSFGCLDRDHNCHAFLATNYVNLIEERYVRPDCLWGYLSMPMGDDYE